MARPSPAICWGHRRVCRQLCRVTETEPGRLPCLHHLEGQIPLHVVSHAQFSRRPVRWGKMSAGPSVNAATPARVSPSFVHRLPWRPSDVDSSPHAFCRPSR